MSMGGGVALFVIGAILAFAVNLQNAFVDLHLVGYILMGAGVVLFLLGLVLALRRRQSVATSRTGYDGATGERVSQRVTESDDSMI